MADGTGAWSFTPTGLADGAHTLTATQTDLAGNTGTATLSFTLDTRPPQPSQSGDIVGLRLQNTGAAAEQSGYVTFGQVFKPGAILPGDSLVARIAGVDYAVQMDVKATHGDGSVRHAILTLNAPEIAAGGSLALMLAKGSAAMPSPAAPSASALLASGYNLDVAFTFHNADGTTTTDNASAAAALQAAINAGNVQRWLTGPEVNEYSVVTTVNGGKLKVEFDIRAYADGTTSTDVIFDNSWMFAPGKSDLTYDVAISQGGNQVYSASNVFQYLYSLWDHRVDSAGTINPNVQYDVSYLIAAAALPAYDQSYGVSNAAIQTNYNKLNPASSSGYGSTGPMGTAEVQPVMGNAGRPTRYRTAAQLGGAVGAEPEQHRGSGHDGECRCVGQHSLAPCRREHGHADPRRRLPVFLARPAQYRRESILVTAAGQRMAELRDKRRPVEA